MESEKKIVNITQVALDITKMIPVRGSVADIVNAEERDLIRPAMNMLASIPSVGDVASMALKSQQPLDQTKKISEQFRETMNDVKKGVFKKTLTGASRKQMSSERLEEMMQEKIKKLEFESSKKCLGNSCFPSGTWIHLKDGQIPIEQVAVGMTVWAKNVETGEMGERVVLSISKTKVRKLFHIFIGDHMIQSTALHKMYVYQRGFIKVQDLKPGDRLIGIQEGKEVYVPIERITVQFYPTPVEVYNFEVDKWHTYRVGELGILVHNGNEDCAGRVPVPGEPKNVNIALKRTTGGQKKGTDTLPDHIVRRGITAEQVEKIICGEGIVKPKPPHRTTPDQHIGGTRHARNPWTSTSRSSETAEYFATHDSTGNLLAKPNPLVEIDLSKIPPENILDVSTPAKAATQLKRPFCRNAAAHDQEVLIYGDVPAEAIVKLVYLYY